MVGMQGDISDDHQSPNAAQMANLNSGSDGAWVTDDVLVVHYGVSLWSGWSYDSYRAWKWSAEMGCAQQVVMKISEV